MESYRTPELVLYVHEDFVNFLAKGFTPAQATSRILVEYEEQLKKTKKS